MFIHSLKWFKTEHNTVTYVNHKQRLGRLWSYRIKLIVTPLFKIQSFKFRNSRLLHVHCIFHAVQQIIIQIYSESSSYCVIVWVRVVPKRTVVSD